MIRYQIMSEFAPRLLNHLLTYCQDVDILGCRVLIATYLQRVKLTGEHEQQTQEQNTVGEAGSRELMSGAGSGSAVNGWRTVGRSE